MTSNVADHLGTMQKVVEDKTATERAWYAETRPTLAGAAPHTFVVARLASNEHQLVSCPTTCQQGRPVLF